MNEKETRTIQPNEIAEVLGRPRARSSCRGPDPASVRRQGRHAAQRPDRLRLERHADLMCTAKNAPKNIALRHNPTVALTIDTEEHPPKILLIRGRAELDVVDGIPDEYLQAAAPTRMTPEQRVEWEAGVRSLYDGMVRVVVTSTWAKLIDFETTLPSAVEQLMRNRQNAPSTWTSSPSGPTG